MTHDKKLTKGIVKGLVVTALFMPIMGFEYLKVLLVFPLMWLLFQGIYNLEGVEK